MQVHKFIVRAHRSGWPENVNTLHKLPAAFSDIFNRSGGDT